MLKNQKDSLQRGIDSYRNITRNYHSPDKYERLKKLITQMETSLETIGTLDEFLDLKLSKTSADNCNLYELSAVFLNKFKSLISINPIIEYQELKKVYERVFNQSCKDYLFEKMIARTTLEFPNFSWKEKFDRCKELRTMYNWAINETSWGELLDVLRKEINNVNDPYVLMEIIKYNKNLESFQKWNYYISFAQSSWTLYPGIIAFERLEKHDFSPEEAMIFFQKEVQDYSFYFDCGDFSKILELLVIPINNGVRESASKLFSIEKLYDLLSDMISKTSASFNISAGQHLELRRVFYKKFAETIAEKMYVCRDQIPYITNVDLLLTIHKRFKLLEIGIANLFQEQLEAIKKVSTV